MEDSPYRILKIFLKKNNFNLNWNELNFQLLSHPSYPSLYSIIDVLTHFGIENLALEVPTDMETLKQLPVTFITIVNGNELVLAEKLDSRVKLIFQENKKFETIGYKDFLAIWNGTVVGIEEGENRGLNDKVTWRAVPKIFLLISAIIPVVLFLASSPDLFQSLHFFAGLGGLFFSISIVRHELGSQSGLINKFCNANDSTSCDAILQSKGATVLNLFKLSDACVVYFSASALTWILYVTLGYYGSTFFISSLLALPIIVYSVHYQYYVVKKWCPLCLGVSGVLFVQAFSTLFLRDGWLWTFEFSETMIFLLCTIAIISVWAFIEPLLLVKQKYSVLRMEHYKFKRNFDLFQAAHYGSAPYSTQLSHFNDKEIILGNPNGKISLVLVTSPLCIYCKAAHSELETVLNRYPNDISLIIRFNVPVHDSTNVGFKVANRLNELFLAEGDSDGFTKALDAAFDNDANLEAWLDHWGGNTDLNPHTALLEEQKQWCLDSQIHFTPALILNGKQYPKEYERMDFIYFVDELLDAEPIHNNESEEKSVELVIRA